MGGGGFPRSFHTCIYIWNETSTSTALSTPHPPRLVHRPVSPFSSPAGEEGWLQRQSWGKGLGGGKSFYF